MSQGSRVARGFSLIEALVSLVVLSVGLLGVAGLQLTSLRSNQGAALRSQATFLAYDIVDRMRANSGAALAGAYNIPFGATGAAGTSAGNDLIAWKQSIANTLPRGKSGMAPDGCIQLDPVTHIVSVYIAWDDTHAAPQGQSDTPAAPPTAAPECAAAAPPAGTDIVTFITSTQLVE